MTTKLSKKIMALAITTITVIGMPTVGASAKWRQMVFLKFKWIYENGLD